MKRSKIVPVAMFAAMTLGAAGTALAATGEFEGGREIAAVLNAKIPIAEAITAAVRQTGGKALKAGIEAEDKAQLYEVTILANGDLTKVFVDPATGQVVRTIGKGMFGGSLVGSEESDLSRANLTLASAIGTAEKELGGKAIEASFHGTDEAVRFDVEVADGQALKKVIVDAASGKVVKILSGDEVEDESD